jgi:hypothetical protein
VSLKPAQMAQNFWNYRANLPIRKAAQRFGVNAARMNAP